MRRKMITSAFVLGLVIALGSGPMVAAQEQGHGYSHVVSQYVPAAVPMAGPRDQGRSVSFSVASLNNSGIGGTTTIRAIADDKTEVDIRVDGAGAGPLPAHFHAGACAELNPEPEIPLVEVANGASLTEPDMPFEQLMATPRVLFMHKSPQELPIFVGCADLAVAGLVTAVPAAGEAPAGFELATWLAALGLVFVVGGLALRRSARRRLASGSGGGR